MQEVRANRIDLHWSTPPKHPGLEHLCVESLCLICSNTILWRLQEKILSNASALLTPYSRYDDWLIDWLIDWFYHTVMEFMFHRRRFYKGVPTANVDKMMGTGQVTLRRGFFFFESGLKSSCNLSVMTEVRDIDGPSSCLKRGNSRS